MQQPFRAALLLALLMTGSAQASSVTAIEIIGRENGPSTLALKTEEMAHPASLTRIGAPVVSASPAPPVSEETTAAVETKPAKKPFDAAGMTLRGSLTGNPFTRETTQN